MNPRAVVLSLVVAVGGTFAAGQLVQAQVDKATVFQPIGVTSTLVRTTFIWEETLSPAGAFDGGHDADGGFLDGGWTGLYVRTLGPQVRVEMEGALLPAIPFVDRQRFTTPLVVNRSNAKMSAIERNIREAMMPLAATQQGVPMTPDGGY